MLILSVLVVLALLPLGLSAQPYDGPTNEASIDAYNNEPISAYSAESDFARLGRGVGLLLVDTNRGASKCTGFLVSDRHVLTNWHCGPGLLEAEETGVTEIRAVTLYLGFTEPGAIENARSYAASAEPVDGSSALDFAVYELEEPVPDAPILPIASRAIPDAMPFWIIGHPRGMSQHISREGCRAGRPAVTEAGDRIQHTCDTLEGNSGSPIIDSSSRMVVGLHAAGHARLGVNYGVSMEDILARSALLHDLDQSAAALDLTVFPTVVGVGDELTVRAEVPPACTPFFVDLGPDGQATPIPLEVFERSALPNGRVRYEVSESSRYGLVIQETDAPGTHRIGYLCGLAADHETGEGMRRVLSDIAAQVDTAQASVSDSGIRFAFGEYDVVR